jgi:hypothetical protein
MHVRNAALLLAWIGLLAVGQPAFAGVAMNACAKPGTTHHYFPPNIFGVEKHSDDGSRRDWYSTQLAAMNEPSLSCGVAGQAYRFTLLRTFHHPVSVRVFRQGDGWWVSAIELSGAGGYAPGTVSCRMQAPLAPADVARLQKMLSDTDAWSMPTEIESNGLDGSQWIIELKDGDRYHVVDRWTPQDGPIHSLGLAFLAFTHWEFPAKQLY